MILALLIGFVAAFISSMPVAGPIAALVVSRCIEGRYRTAMMLAIGSGLAESVYAFIALFGFSSFVTEYPLIRPASKLLAAVILIVLGIFFARHRSPDPDADVPPPRDNLMGSFLLGLSITALNPTLFVTWSGFAPTLDAMEIVDFEPAMSFPFAIGVCTGTIAWFGFLVGLLKRYKSRFRQETLDAAIRVMGWALIGLGLVLAWNFVEFLMVEEI